MGSVPLPCSQQQQVSDGLCVSSGPCTPHLWEAVWPLRLQSQVAVHLCRSIPPRSPSVPCLPQQLRHAWPDVLRCSTGPWGVRSGGVACCGVPLPLLPCAASSCRQAQVRSRSPGTGQIQVANELPPTHFGAHRASRAGHCARPHPAPAQGCQVWTCCWPQGWRPLHRRGAPGRCWQRRETLHQRCCPAAGQPRGITRSCASAGA